MNLTSAGKALLAHSRTLLQEWDKIRGEALRAENEVRGKYTLGVHPSVALYSLPGILPDLMSEFPELQLELIHDLSRKVTEKVISLELDCGIVVNPVSHPDLVIHRICSDEVTLWTCPSKKSSLNQLDSGKAVLICDPSLIQTQTLLKSKRVDFKKFSRTVASGNLEVVRSLVAAGAGMGILPARVASLSTELKAVPGSPTFADSICLVYRMERKKDPLIMDLKERLTHLK